MSIADFRLQGRKEKCRMPISFIGTRQFVRCRDGEAAFVRFEIGRALLP